MCKLQGSSGTFNITDFSADTVAVPNAMHGSTIQLISDFSLTNVAGNTQENGMFTVPQIMLQSEQIKLSVIFLPWL